MPFMSSNRFHLRHLRHLTVENPNQTLMKTWNQCLVGRTGDPALRKEVGEEKEVNFDAQGGSYYSTNCENIGFYGSSFFLCWGFV